MGTLIDPTSQPTAEHISSGLVNTDNVKVGNSGSMKVDKRFHMYDPKTGKDIVQHLQQHLGTKGTLNPSTGIAAFAPTSFHVKVTSTTKEGHKVNILDTLKHTETHSATTDYYSAHLAGQQASQIAFELQKRYGSQ